MPREEDTVLHFYYEEYFEFFFRFLSFPVLARKHGVSITGKLFKYNLVKTSISYNLFIQKNYEKENSFAFPVFACAYANWRLYS